MSKSSRAVEVGSRVRVDGCHRNYTPTVMQIVGDVALLATPEVPNSQPKWVKVARLELA